MSSIKAGVIGLGFIGPAHVEALRRLGGVEVVAVAGARPGSTQAKAARMGVPQAYDTWQELLADPDVQVVHNCTPNFLHTEINLAAIAAGKHVVSEKPLGIDAAEAASLVQAAQSAGIVHEVCFNNRMYPLTREMHARVSSGSIVRRFCARTPSGASSTKDLASGAPNWKMAMSCGSGGPICAR